MSFDPFPEHIDPLKLFARNGTLSGCIPLDKFSRLGSLLGAEQNNENSLVNAFLHFTKDENNLPLLEGKAESEVNIQCQRCLGTIPLNLHAELELVLVKREEAAEVLADTIEWLHLNIEELDVLALLEDELILSLPIVAYHDDENCNKELSALRRAAKEKASKEVRSPFASLEALKSKLKD